MSRIFLGNALTLALVYSTAGTACADNSTTDSLKQGDSIGVFYVTKVAGAEDDGVEPGEELCYRCRYGSRPMIMVFARDTSGKVTDLVKQIDAAVANNEDASLKGLFTLIGEDAARLKEDASKFAEKAAVKNVPVVVAKETRTGPLNYKLADDAAVTIIVAKDSQVVNTHVFAADKIDIAAVMTDVEQLLH
jgi:hypothetical protein